MSQGLKQSGDSASSAVVDPLPNVLSRFPDAKQTGDRQYIARCPCHEDSDPSLSIGQPTPGGAVLINCHAACATQQIVERRGLTMADLFPPRPTRETKRGRVEVASYDYCDADGKLVFQAVRFEPKDFRQRRPDGNGGWIWNVSGCPKLLYRLPELIAANAEKPVFVVEGEKDVDRLQSIGVLATCNTGGAGKWKADHAAPLAGRNVIILPDNDDPGRKHAQQAYKSLAGKAASVKIVELPGLPPKGDISDWLDCGGTAEQLIALSENSAPAEVDAAAVEPVRVISSAEFFAANYRRDYIIEEILTAGEPAFIGGRPKTLKTSIACDAVMSIGTGSQFLGRFNTSRRRCAFISSESGDYTLQDMARRIAFSRKIADPGSADVFWGFDSPCLSSDDGLAALTSMIEAHDIEVLFVDPIYLSLMGESTRGLNAGSLFDIGPLLKSLTSECRANDVTLILLHHCRKNSPKDEFSMPELEELAMAGFAEFARQWLLLGRREEYHCDGEHRLWMNVGGSAGHGGKWALDVSEGVPRGLIGRRWEVALRPSQDAEQEKRKAAENRRDLKKREQSDEWKTRLLKALAKYPEGETGTVLREAAQLSGNAFKSLSKTLESESVIEQCEVIKKGRSRVAWRLAKASEASGASGQSVIYPDVRMVA
jgi:hypothetical protein